MQKGALPQAVFNSLPVLRKQSFVQHRLCVGEEIRAAFLNLEILHASPVTEDDIAVVPVIDIIDSFKTARKGKARFSHNAGKGLVFLPQHRAVELGKDFLLLPPLQNEALVFLRGNRL